MRIEPFEAVLTVLAADAPFVSARAPAVPIAAMPPARSSPLRVVLASSPPRSAGPITCSDIVHLRIDAGAGSGEYAAGPMFGAMFAERSHDCNAHRPAIIGRCGSRLPACVRGPTSSC